MYRLVLLRHGESTWNKENRFTGWTDVDLSDKGRDEARQAGRLMSAEKFEFDVAYTSVLKRAIRTLWIALDEIDMMWIPVHRSWRLHERHYALPPPPLEADDPRHPSHDRRYDSLPRTQVPLTESLKDTVARFLPYW